MAGFYRTNLGRVALQQRNIVLNAKQRRLLLLIDHEDFQNLNGEFKKRIASPELIQQLVDLELIAPAASTETLTDEEIILKTSQINKVEENQKESIGSSIAHSPNLVGEIQLSEQKTLDQSSTTYFQPVISSKALSFEEIQLLMMKTLSSYCGLMTKPLVQRIEKTTTIQELKLYQIHWITNLQESRIPPQELASALRTINYSIQLLQESI
ncbi:hypothetical protein VXP84_01770 [Acinetobacter oleivorans]|uniref:Uncharacterized protein n=1 Tax=Acinetobacter oleivorans (strain JCM 16667 / KCTC 23045 / DR1) TaxID=436717 RepID=A0AAN0P702_ACISD|nr:MULTISPECIES: hypothetical protein [Acinetobacter]ADI89992.1 hypothetical protein AOLE_05475 [Acinetobacter oleivorans DR1]ENX43716.1 hypothetical protein F886_03069 [Acinetobacter sp. NIPH 542]ESK46464.1 hypothetical protein P254_00349 [Acinetobacter oleivorans CIP 110421]MBJ9419101.1 hypothetical protein [Acinetobacter oleivorans]